MNIIRCLVLQLGDRSEIVQSMIALKAAKQLYPRLDITMVCREDASDVAKATQWVREVVDLPAARWARTHRSGAKAADELLKESAGWISRIGADPWDLLVNWSFSDSSSMLSALIPAHERIGYSRRSDLDFSSGDGWSQFIQAYVQQEIPQNIHLVDILTTQLLTALQRNHGDPIDAGNQAVTGPDFFASLQTAGDRLLDPERIWVGVQLDSFWNARQWSKAVNLILERHPEVHLVLLGEPSFRDLASQLPTHPRRMLNLVGETDLDLWIDCLSQCQWVITASRFPGDLAAALGTRTIRLYDSHHPETIRAPYGNGHLILSPTDVSVPLTPEALYAAWSYSHFEWSHRRSRTFEEHLSLLGYDRIADWIDVRSSRIRPSDDGGGVTHESEFNRPLTPREWLAVVNGQLARLWYCGWTAEVGSEIRRASIRPVLLQDLRAIEESSSVLIRVAGEALRSAQEMTRRTQQLKSSTIMSIDDRRDLETQGRRILELQKLVDRLSAADPHLLGFSTLLKVMMHNLSDDHISDVSRETAAAWQQIERGAELLRTWLAHTLRLARPMMVESPQLTPLP